jgi:hypothetical protein
MIDSILAQARAAESDLRPLCTEYVQQVRESAWQGNLSEVEMAEAAVRADPGGAFAFDAAGRATLTVGDRHWQAGRLTMPALHELRDAARRETTSQAELRFWVWDGASPLTDIGSLQATAGDRSLFQVASQFNCLESPGPYLVPVADYVHDPTQGPRASISAFPATLLRHYAAPGPQGERFIQSSHTRQIDLLADVFAPAPSPVRNGYLTNPGSLSLAEFTDALETRFERIRLGVHEGAQVVLGYNWRGSVLDSEYRRITQVFTSTLAGGGYGGESNFGPACYPVSRQLLRGAYLGTLLAAVALRKSPVVLTLIGGGVFRNPISLIWEAILWAIDEVRPLLSESVDVVLNGYNLSYLLGSRGWTLEDLLPDVKAHGGAILQFDAQGLATIY